MSYVLLDANAGRDLIRRGFIPGGLRDRLNELYIFGEIDSDSKVIAVAVFEDCYGDKVSVALKYIFVREDLRGKKHAARLFEYAQDAFFSIQIKKIIAESIVEKSISNGHKCFLLALGFLDEYTDMPVLRFRRGHFRGNKSELLYKNLDKAGLKFEVIDDYNDKRLRYFLAKNAESGIHISQEEYDPNLCAFSIRDGEIVAALCLKCIDGNSLISDKFYVFDDIENRDYILPFMIAYLSKRLAKYNDDIEYIYAVFEKKYRKDAVLATFGENADEYCKQRYMLIAD